MQGDRHKAMKTLKGIDLRGLAGSACLWAWVDTLYKSGFFTPFHPEAQMAEIAVWLTFLLIVALSAVVLWKRASVRSLCANRGFGLACGVAGSVGSALFAVSAWLDSWALLVIGALFASAFMGMAILLWGAVYCKQGERSATIYVAGGFACALVPDITFMLMESVASALAPIALPVLSMALFASLPQDMRTYEQKKGCVGSAGPTHDGLRPAKTPLARLRLGLGVSLPTVLSLALIMFGLGYMQHRMSFSPVQGAGPDMGIALQVTRGLIAAALFALAVVAPKRTHIAYRVGLLAIIAGFSLMPLLAQTAQFWMSGAVVLSGYTTFDVLIWVIVAQVAYAGMSDGLTVTCAVRMLVSSLFCGLGGIAGIWLDGLASSVTPFPYADAIFVGYLMTIAAVLVLSGRDVWDLFDARPAPAPTAAAADQKSPDEALDDLAQSWGLTGREREVFGFLAMGRTQPWVAERLSISESTVNSHVRHIYGKANVNSRQELLDLVFRAQSPEPVDMADNLDNT